MKKSYFVLRQAICLFALPVFAATVQVYVTNNAGTTIDVIDTATQKVVQVLRDIEVPESARFAPDGSRVYVTSAADVLTVFDRKSGKIIKRVPLSGHANDLQVTTDGKYVLVCIRSLKDIKKRKITEGSLDVIDTQKLEKVQSIPIEGLHDIEVTPDGKYAVVGSPEAKKATVFDLKTPGFPKAWDVTFDQRVMPIAIEADSHGAGRRIFLQLDRTNGFVVVDFLTHKEVARIKYPAEFQTFDLGVRAPSHGIVVTPDGKVVVCNSHASNSIFFYSIPDYKLLGRVALAEERIPGKNKIGAMPEWIDVTPDGKLVYVSNSTFDNVSAIDVKTMKVVAHIPVGEVPKRLSILELP
ncbi:MAG TPA: hypothetical protein VHW09_08005 [Bryobacteraceae bacterium]|jgi:YVTN family beta-propeller protein|nr:hypothetical protein [Bryobacteraceae bacterium]